MDGNTIFGIPFALWIIALLIAWIIMPFGVFGTRNAVWRSNKIAKETKTLIDETNDLLSRIGKQLVAQTELLERIEAVAMGNEPPPRTPIEEPPPVSEATDRT